MKKLLLILLCLPFIGFGQGWEKTFGGIDVDEGSSVQQTTDGGYVITGHTNSFGNGNYDVYLIKTDGNGIEQWSKTFGGTGDDLGRSVQQTTDGGYIITGRSFGSGYADVYLIKTDGNGDSLWTKTFGGEGFSVQQTTDGGYIITGQKSDTQGADVYLIKTDGNGDSLWTKTFDNGIGYSVQQTSDGGYIITGYTTSFGNGLRDVYLIKTDDNGVEQWNQTFGGTGTDMGYSVQQTTDGGYVITGQTDSFLGGSDADDVYLIKTDGNGIEQWAKVFNCSFPFLSQDYAYSVQQTTDGGYIIVGRSSMTVLLMKTDNNGIEEWTQMIGGATSREQGSSVQQTTDGGYIIAGGIESPPLFYGNINIYLIKTDGNGNVTSTFNIPINPNRKLEKVVDILGRDIKPQTNTPFIEIYDDGTVEKRIVIE